MTSAVSAVEAIEMAMDGVTLERWSTFVGRGGTAVVVADERGDLKRYEDGTVVEVPTGLGAYATYIAACNPVAMREVLALALARQAEALERENAELREALKPFAEEAGCYDPDTGDSDDSVWATPVNFKIRDLRRARALLGGDHAGN